MRRCEIFKRIASFFSRNVAKPIENAASTTAKLVEQPFKSEPEPTFDVVPEREDC